MSFTARDLMQRNVGIIDAGASLAELEAAFEEAGVSGFPVVDGGRVVGVVSRTDVVRRLGTKLGEEPRLSTFYSDLASFGGEFTESFAETAARSGRPIDGLCVSDLMTASVVTVAPGAPLEELALALVEHHIHRLLVTDSGTLVGVVSSLDVVRLVAEEKLGPV